MTDSDVRGDAEAWLAAVVGNSFDAILSKTLDGVITSWNGGAERLFGYAADEAIGHSITIIIPPDRLNEEDAILARLRRGERIEGFETIRRHRDGRLLDIELTVSPVRDRQGNIVGASKIARDIGERKAQREAHGLIVREMHHRVKNLLTVVHSLVGFSRRQVSNGSDFADDFAQRIRALATAHDLILVDPDRPRPGQKTSLGQLVEAILRPYRLDGHISFGGSSLLVGANAVTTLALLLHELATNAIKHGALSSGGTLDIAIEPQNNKTRILWREAGVPQRDDGPKGLGTGLLKVAIMAIDGRLERHWDADILTITIDIPNETLEI